MKTNEKNLQKNKDKTFTLKFTIKKEDIQKTHQEVLSSLQKTFKSKGFRTGNVPLNIVEKQSTFEGIFEQVASKIVSQEYAKIIKENELKPIVQPKVKFSVPPTDFKTDWQIELTSCELPEIELDKDYLKKVKEVHSKSKEKDEKKKTEEIVQTIIKNAKLDLPEILIESDIQHQLSQLVNQAQQAGITVQQYLESQKTDLKTYQENLKKRIVKEWTLNLSIQKIAKDQKLTVSEQEVKDMVQKNPALGQNVNLINFVLTQQKVLDFLKK